jgi:hypothetical protein
MFYTYTYRVETRATIVYVKVCLFVVKEFRRLSHVGRCVKRRGILEMERKEE